MEQNERKYADWSSDDLLYIAGWWRTLKWVLGGIAILGVILVVSISAAVMTSSSTTSDSDGLDSIMLVFFGLGTVFLAYMAYRFGKSEKAMRAELARRCRNDNDRAYVEEELKAPVKSIKKVILVIVALLILTFVVVPMFKSCGEKERGGNGITSCKNCGRKTDLVPGYGYCGNCYKGFNEWQDNYYDD